MKKYKKFGKPWYRWVFGYWPLRWLWLIWNPLKVVNKEGMMIADIAKRRRGKKLSKQERQRRKDAGEAERQCFTVQVIRSLDFEGGSD